MAGDRPDHAGFRAASAGAVTVADPVPEMEPRVFDRLREFIYARCGILVDSSKKSKLESRLAARLDRLGLTTFEGYLDLLQQGGINRDELEFFFDAITVNETRFFRDLPQFDALEGMVMGQIALAAKERGDDRIRLLSAACSTGEEPYTMAMVLDRYSERLAGLDAEVMGLDLSPEVLEAARRARYLAPSVRNVPEEFKNSYLSRDGAKFFLDRRIRKRVQFHQGNLMEFDTLEPHGRFDVIFCRNVMIYFDTDARRRALGNLYEMLVPGGYLFIGHSESLHGVEDRLKLVHFIKAIGYRK